MDQPSDASIKKFKVFKTFLLGVLYMSEGMALETIGPTLPDVQARFHSTYEEIARVLSSASLGSLVGCVILASLVQRWRRLDQPLLILSFFCVGILSFLIPKANSIQELCHIFAFNGFFVAGFGIAGPTIMLRMWEDKVTVPIHAIHVGYGLGGMITPLIAEPYISHNGSPSQLWVPWQITGTIAIFSSFILACVFIYGRSTKLDRIALPSDCTAAKNRLLGSTSPRTFSKDSQKSEPQGRELLFIVISFQLVVFTIVGVEKVWSKYLMLYCTQGPAAFSVSASTSVLSCFWLAFVFGRVSSLVLSSFVPVAKLLSFEIGVNLLVVSALPFIIGSMPSYLYVASCVFGLLISPLYPAFFGLVGQRCTLPPLGIMAMNMGSAAGALVYQWATGYLIDLLGVEVIPHLCTIALLLLVFKAGILYALLTRRIDLSSCSVSQLKESVL